MIYRKTINYLNGLNISDEEKSEQIQMLNKVLEQKTLKEQYDKAFDLICNYLDKKFNNCDYCKFKDDVCIMRREISKKNNKPLIMNGCCYSIKNKKNCKYFSKNRCTIQNIACKLYTCTFLKKQGIKCKLSDIYFTKYLFNNWQKFYISETFFLKKEKVLKEIYKRKIFKFKLK